MGKPAAERHDIAPPSSQNLGRRSGRAFDAARPVPTFGTLALEANASHSCSVVALLSRGLGFATMRALVRACVYAASALWFAWYGAHLAVIFTSPCGDFAPAC